MPTKYKDYPVYTYDEPAIYEDFSGGINTDPSNEHLTENELRDCLNMHYQSGALVKRQGASLLSNMHCEDELYNIQGVFLFTYRTTYIIVAADGRLYWGYYNSTSTINLQRLHIYTEDLKPQERFSSSNNYFDLDEYETERLNIKHDGFIYYYTKDLEGKLVKGNYRGRFTDITEGLINKNDIVTYNNVKYICKQTYSKTVIKPTDTTYWLTLEAYNKTYASNILTGSDLLTTLIYKNNTSIQGLSFDYTTKKYIRNEGTIGSWEEQEEMYTAGMTAVYNGTVYICIQEHYNYNAVPTTSPLWGKLNETLELIFQNYRKIEAATYANKLYIATGTRFVEVYLQDNILRAHILTPYECNGTEITEIGYNYLSPFPEYCLNVTQTNTVTTSISSLIVTPLKGGQYLLQPQMNYQYGESSKDYYFKWEKKINGNWYVIISFKDNVNSLTKENTNEYATLIVTDADRYQYRVTFAKSFTQPLGYYSEWDASATYKVGDLISVGTTIYKCKKAHKASDIKIATSFSERYFKDGLAEENEIEGLPETLDSASNYYKCYLPNFITASEFYAATPKIYPNNVYKATIVGESLGWDITSHTLGSHESIVYWEVSAEETFIDKYVEDLQTVIVQGENVETNYIATTDYTIDEVSGGYFGSATSVLAVEFSDVNDTYKIIQSCTKIHTDGNKFLLYGDKYNSGQWFKTVVNNPCYITSRGCLSFKTIHNEELLKVVSFQGNLIAFANSDNTGGSIHLISGNGDDYDSNNGYYSPYVRKTINSSISCDNAYTVQICQNYLFFKYFDTIYFISSSDLSNDVVQVTSINDRVKQKSTNVEIPWDDNTCISEATDTYYALIWKEKYIIQDDELILVHPGMRVKCYYNIAQKIGERYYMPWLRDESKYFNIDFIIYIKGKPIYLYNNTLISFHNKVYTDFDDIYPCKLILRGVDLNYPKLYKLISNILVYYHRNQYSNIDFDLLVKNEAGHILLDSTQKVFSIQDLRALRLGDTVEDYKVRLDSTILDSKVINTSYKFPCLLAETTIISNNDKEFSFSSITFNYTTIETPDTNSYDLYSSIIRPKEVK